MNMTLYFVYYGSIQNRIHMTIGIQDPTELRVKAIAHRGILYDLAYACDIPTLFGTDFKMEIK